MVGHLHRDSDKTNEVFRSIIENCNNLSEINVLKDINDSNLQEFYRKFGPKIKCLRALEQVIELGRFPNIEKVMINNLYVDSIIPQLNLAKLKQLEIAFERGQENMLQTFIDNFPKLTHFNVVNNSIDGKAIYKPLKNISKLKHLIHFKLQIPFGKNNKQFCDLLKQMANNCRNLKSIGFRFNINDQNPHIRQLLSLLRAFPLKRLDIIFVGNDIDVNQLFSFELFKGFENITHLSVYFNQILNESILKEIDINLPKLQYLEITYEFDTTPEAVIKIADILSRLSRLERLKLWFESGVDFKPIKKQIVKKCRKIRIIEINISDF